MRIEPELVDAVITEKAVPQEVGDGAHLVRELVTGLVGFGGAGRAAVMIDVADDGGNLIGRRAHFGLGKQRGVLARRLGTLVGTPLRCGAT
jgi:hypothetical protein